jgi:prepilin-type N-terminal cleavage/methylation domain-containing protein/prepilin-type processing-associated H-X9-DG protein
MEAVRSNSGTERKRGAFTLVELLVVIGVIGILAGLLLTVLSSAKKRGRQAQCLNNVRQIGLALNLYHGDFDDQFPAPDSVSRYGPQPEDWIHWQYGRGVTNSTIAPYVSGFNASLFTCPSDEAARRLQAEGQLFREPYRYSYALTSYDLDGGRNPGMASIITRDRKAYPFRITQVHNPVAKLMILEEARETIDDPRWVPHGSKPNLVTDRHHHEGNVLFADFHVETVTPKYGQNPTNSRPSL